MSQVFRRRAALAAGLVVLLTSSVVSAQAVFSPRQQQPQPGAGLQQMPAALAHVDAQLAACLAVDNQNEVALGQFAQQKTQNDDVKKFAQMMVEQHGQMLAKLQQFTGEARGEQRQPGQDNRGQGPQGQPAVQPEQPGAAQAPPAGAAPQQLPPQGAGQPGDQHNAQRQPAQPTQQRQAFSQNPATMQPHGGLDFVGIKQEIGQQCLQSARKELDAKNGAEFDMCYIGMQVGAHMHAIDSMEVLKRHASPNLQAALDEGLQTARTHLDHAKDLAKKLMKQHDDTARTAQRDTSETRGK